MASKSNKNKQYLQRPYITPRENYYCRRCHKRTTRKIALEGKPPERLLCRICEMMERTDLDRTGRHSKKDKAKNKHERKAIY